MKPNFKSFEESFIARSIGLAAFALLLVSSTSHAAVKLEATSGATATFEATGKPALLKIQGKGAKVEGAVDVEGKSATGEFKIDLAQFTTGIDTRDEHMKDKYLEVQKFPKATLKIESVELPEGWAPGTAVKDANFKGQLTVKDVTKPITGKVSVGAGEMASKADFEMKLSDYPSVGVPSFKGITVADSVKVHVEIPKFVRK